MHGTHHDWSNDIATTYVLDDYADEHGRTVHVYDGARHPDRVHALVELSGDKRTAALAAIGAAIGAELGAVQHVQPEQRPAGDDLRHLRDAVTDACARAAVADGPDAFDAYLDACKALRASLDR